MHIKEELIHNAEVLFIHFSARNCKYGKFNHYPTPEYVSNIYLNPCDHNWYTKGIPSLGNNLDDTINYLNELITKYHFNEVYCIGSSMGAYGAYVYASLIKANFIGFGTELILGLRGGYSYDNSFRFSEENLLKIYPKRSLFIAGALSPIDVLTSLHYSRNDRTSKLFILKKEGHGTAKYLKDNGFLELIIKDFIEKKDFDKQLFEHLIDISYFSDISTDELIVNDDFYLKYYNILKSANLNFSNKLQFVGNIISRKIFGASNKIINELIYNYGNVSELIFLQAKSLRKLKLYKDSIEKYTLLVDNFLYKEQVLFEISQIHNILKNKEEEKLCYEKIIKTLEAKTIYTFSKKELENMLNDDNKKTSTTDYELITPQNFQKRIQEYRNSKDLIQAEELAKKALIIFPNNLILLSEYAWNSQVKNDYLEAKKRLENLIKIHNGNVTEKMYSRLLSVYENLKIEEEELEILLEKALQKYPNSEKIKAYKIIEKKTDVSDNFEIIVLTTFPKHASNNVGDQLITYSFLRLLQKRLPDLKYHIEFRANNLDKYVNKNIKYILAPGFSISNEVYPKIYGLYSDLNNLPKFLPIGCSFQHISPSHEVFESNEYSETDKDFFHNIKKKMDYSFLCRDGMIYNMLVKNNIQSTYSGDMAIYDEDYLNKPFIAPKNINSIVFTIGHHEKYEYQSYCLLSLIKNCFPNVKLYVSYHSKINPRSKKIGHFAVSLGYEEVFMFGDVENLDFYNNIDLHIGYRLHGHISFLRRRKPSILLVEDARSYGFANTIGTHVGCFNALNADETINNFAPIDAIKFVENEIKNEFKSYNEIFSFIDKTFNNTLLPIIDQLVLELQN